MFITKNKEKRIATLRLRQYRASIMKRNFWHDVVVELSHEASYAVMIAKHNVRILSVKIM